MDIRSLLGGVSKRIRRAWVHTLSNPPTKALDYTPSKPLSACFGSLHRPHTFAVVLPMVWYESNETDRRNAAVYLGNTRRRRERFNSEDTAAHRFDGGAASTSVSKTGAPWIHRD